MLPGPNSREPGRLFRITAVHGFTYETVYIGFEPQPPRRSPDDGYFANVPGPSPRPTPPRPSALADHTKFMVG